MKKLTISIVNYNSGDYLLKCLESLKSIEKELDFDVYVVDNASTDASFSDAKKKYPEFNFINNTKNLGYGKAHNQVLKKANTAYFLTLNPDTYINKGVISFMVNFMEKNPEVGASTCKIEKLDGSLDYASHRGFPTIKASFYYFFLKDDKYYHLTYKNMNEVHEVDSIVGAFMMLRRSALEKTGYFDEDFFLYGEDIDLCFRIKKAGFKVMYVPDVSITHTKGISSGIKKHSSKDSYATDETKERSLESFYKSMEIFYKKHLANEHNFFVNQLIYWGIDLKRRLARYSQT